MYEHLAHYGILGMKWGVRRYQNQDGSLTPQGRKRLEKKDVEWVKKKGTKIADKVKSETAKEAAQYAYSTMGDKARTSQGKISKTFINQYNRKLSELMNQRVGDISAPSGKVLRFVAKRGELGVHTALADQGYNMNQVRNGVNAAGRIAYRKDILDKRG